MSVQDKEKINLVNGWLVEPFSAIAYCNLCLRSQFIHFTEIDNEGFYVYKLKPVHDKDCLTLK